MYERKSRVRYSEVGPDGLLLPDAVVNYFQDCSIFHSEDIGLGIGYLKKNHRVWVLNAWQIIIRRYPRLGEEISIRTCPYGFHGFLGDRNFMMLDVAGAELVQANSLWIYLDTDTGRPAKVGQAELDGYVLEPKLTMDYADRKIRLSGCGRQGEPVKIKPHQIDTNHHVNNCQYVRMACDLIPPGFTIGQIRAEYKKSAMLGDIVVPVCYEADGCYSVRLCDAQDDVYAVVEFTEMHGE